MKKKLLLFTALLCCLAIGKSYSQVINEDFENAAWQTALPSTGTSSGSNRGTIVVPSTSYTSTMTYYTSAATSASLTSIQTYRNFGSWMYSRGSLSTDDRLRRVHSKTNSWQLGGGTGYLISPTITGGVATITFWMAPAGDFKVGINTSTDITGTVTYTSNGTELAGFTYASQSYAASGTGGNSSMQAYTFTGSFNGPCRIGFFNASGSNIYVDDIVVTAPIATTTLIASQASLGFGNQQASTNSTSQSFDLSGVLLTGFPGSLTVTAPNTDFQVSNNNTAWASSTTIAYTAATLAATPVYVRFTPQTTGAKSGNVTVAGGGATTINIAVSGTGTGPIYSFRSKQTGNWSDASTWEYNNGTTWVNATAAPTDADGTINIQNAHVVTVNAATSADELTIDAGGRIEVASGNTLTIANGTGTDITVNGTLKNSGTLTLTGTLAFGTAGVYQHDATTAIPTLTWSAGSTCLVTGGTGVPSGGFGQSFANLTWNCAAQTGNVVIAVTGFAVTGNFNVISTGTTGGIQMISSGGVTNSVVGSYTQSGGYIYVYPSSSARSLTCNGDFTMTGGNFGITGFLTSAGTGSATLFVKGNVNIGNGSTISKTLGTTANFELNGTSAQTISIGSTATVDTFNTNFNNAAGVTLLSPVTLKGNATFTSGLVNTTSTNILTILSNGTIGGGSSTSFVNGPMQRSLDVTSSTALVFPIGKTASYSPATLTVTQDAVTATTYKAEAFLTAPAGNTLPVTLSKVSDKRYYAISKGTGANVTAAQVQLSYDATDESVTGVSLTDKAKIRVAKDNGSGAWLNIGPTAGGSANATGTATSDVNFTSFGQFAIANSVPAVPVKFISFNAQETNGKTKLTWQVGEEVNIAGYEVERAIGSNNFVNIAQHQANGSNTYSVIDATSIAGTNLYRIKAVEKDGSILYSMTVKIVKGKAGKAEITVMPNPIKDRQMTLHFSGYEKGNYSLVFYNAAGAMVYSKPVSVGDGNTTLQVALPSNLSKGMYQLVVADGQNRNTKAIIIE